MTLGDRAFLEWCCDRVACCFTYKGCQCNGDVKQQSNHFPITTQAWSKIVIAPLTIIFRMGQWLCSEMFCQSRLPIQLLCWNEIQSLNNYHWNRTKHCWRSIHLHLPNGAVTMQCAVVPIKAGNPAVMIKRDSIPIRITILTWEKIVDTLWTVIFWIGQ